MNKHLCGNFTCATIGLVREILIENELFPRESWDLEPIRTRLQKRSQASQIVSAGTDGQAVFMQAVQIAQNHCSIQIDDLSLRCFLG